MLGAKNQTAVSSGQKPNSTAAVSFLYLTKKNLLSLLTDFAIKNFLKAQLFRFNYLLKDFLNLTFIELLSLYKYTNAINPTEHNKHYDSRFKTLGLSNYVSEF